MGVTWLEVFVVGMVANFITDLYEFLLERSVGKNRDWHLVGRWVAYLGRGILGHNNIANTPAARHEFSLGWLFHYLVGIYFAAIYLVILALGLQQPPGLLNGLAFGMITVLAPWLILIPGLGGGVFAWKTERPNFVRITSLSVHGMFGIGLYLGTLIYAAIW
ncbi:MAG: DUF2938 family protein [Proteobacteria bacterium]|nr:DUF2938 family protein [Pseudomonadota bacterium]